ncbi:hypothetical protein F5884DRAFT_506575 [Xylogone sp. PMI_703]|nr:hypothetical protein F5884DRAFT_506575 [Xylogone sp. PMI_703]
MRSSLIWLFSFTLLPLLINTFALPFPLIQTLSPIHQNVGDDSHPPNPRKARVDYKLYDRPCHLCHWKKAKASAYRGLWLIIEPLLLVRQAGLCKICRLILALSGKKSSLITSNKTTVLPLTSS